MSLLWAVGASIVVSLISFVGAISLLLSEKNLNRILIVLIGFSAGGLIGGAFLHILPESLEHCPDAVEVFVYCIIGFLIFLFLERYLYWRHCHEERCRVHTFTYLNLIGNTIHNFTDGLIIGASFITSVNLGLIATLAIIFHEIPQELGDFGVLIYGGFGKAKAMLYNFLSALTAILGTFAGYYFAQRISGFSSVILPIAAGGFIYIAACDLIPEIHKQTDMKKSNFSMIAFVIGILLMYLVKGGHAH